MIVDILAIVGLHWIIKYGSILNKPRKIFCKMSLIKSLIKCSLCLGFWCGLIVGVISQQNILTYGFAGAAMCWLADNINIVLQRVDILLDK